MILILIIVFFSFAAYNFTVQRYLSKSIFSENCTIPRLLVTTLVNFATVFIILTSNLPFYELIAMLAYLFLIFIELRIFYKSDIPSAIFAAMIFSLSLFATRVMITSIYVISSDIPLMEIHESFESQMVINIISFLLPIPHILIMSRVITKRMLDVVRTDRQNLMFSNIIMAILFVYLSSINFIYASDSGTEVVEIVLLRVSILVLFTYVLALVYTYIFAALQFSAIKCEQLSHIVAVEERSVRELKETASTDQFTGLKLRSTAEEIVNIYLEQKRNFFVILFDIDGLKMANDEYGHDEGDFYILKVAKTLSIFFSDDTVSRVGGDEFLVVGAHDDEYEYIKKSVQCNREITQLQSRYKKPYITSISYGMVHVGVDNVTNFNDIYSLADHRMYSFKRTNKKERRK